MIRMTSTQYGLTVERVWWWDCDILNPPSKAQLVRYLRLREEEYKQLAGLKSRDYADTLISDLTQDEDTLLSLMNKNYRNEIRRAEREGAEAYFYKACDILEDNTILDEFVEVYMRFCEAMDNVKLKHDLDMKKVWNYISNDCVLLTKGIQSDAVVFHLYVMDSSNAVLCYSASDFRDSKDRALAGRLNKMLHWKDMLHLKSLGCKAYDWGNVSTADTEKYNGIDVFKAGFGGEPRRVWNALAANSLLGNMAVIGKKIILGRAEKK